MAVDIRHPQEDPEVLDHVVACGRRRHLERGIDKADGNAVRQLLEMGTGISPGRSLNVLLRNKIVLSRFYSKLEEMMGGRLKRFPRSAIQDGVIDWSVVGPYTTDFSNDDVGRICVIKHRYMGWQSTVRMIPGASDFKVTAPWSDESAKVEHDTMHFQLRSRFKDQPRANIFYNGLQPDALSTLAERLNAEHLGQKTATTEGAVETTDETEDLKRAIKKRKVAPRAPPRSRRWRAFSRSWSRWLEGRCCSHAPVALCRFLSSREGFSSRFVGSRGLDVRC